MNWSKDIAWKHEPGMYLRDTLVRDSQIAISGFGSRSTFVHVYFNGLYFGVFNIAERPECKFMASYFGGDAEDYYSVNHNGTVDGDSTRWDTAQRFNRLHEHVNVESFCDYIILNWATGMGDWPWNNYYAGLRNRPPGQIYFIAWDAEHAFWTNPGYLHSNPSGWVNPLFLNRRPNRFRGSTPIIEIWRALVNDPEFRVVFADRVHRHLFGTGELSDHRMSARFQRLVSQIDKAMVAESCRWGDSAWGREDKPHTRDHDFRGNCRKVAELIRNNSSVFVQELRKHDLVPNVTAPELLELESHFTTSPLSLDFRPTANDSHQIYYTLDGSDPRLPGGSLNPRAKQWTKPELLQVFRSVRVQARTKDGHQWSPLLDRTVFDRRFGIPLRITEIMYQPSQKKRDESLEFIEMQNVGNTVLDLMGFHLEGLDYRFPPGKQLKPKQVVVLIPNDAPNRFRGQYPNVAIDGTYRQHLSNDGERIAVIDRQGQVVTEIHYKTSEGWPAEARGSGLSIHCHDVDNANLSASWFAGPATPGTTLSTTK